MKKVLIIFIVCVLFGIGYLIFWPVDADIGARNFPPPAERIGVLAPNNKLSQATRFGPKTSGAPEDVVVDQEGNLITGLANGEIFRISINGDILERIAIVSPHVLGIAFAQDGTLYVANVHHGLLQVKDGKVTTLLTEVDGKPLKFTEEIALAKDGTVYFTNGSTKFGMEDFVKLMVDSNATGQLLSYDPKTKETKTLADGIHFANGVTLSHDESFLIISEMITGKLLRYWLTGEKAGKLEVFIERLPGIPDNISQGSNGLYWLAMPAKRLDKLSQSVLAQKILANLPLSVVMMMVGKKESMIAAINDQGEIVHFLEDGDQKLPPVTSVIEKDGYLYLGSWQGKYLHRIPAPKSTTVQP